MADLSTVSPSDSSLSRSTTSSPSITTSISSTFSPKTTDHAPALTTDPTSSATDADSSTDASRSTTDDRNGLVNYYFVFLALILCVIFAFLWVYYRRRQSLAFNRASTRDDALSRDLSQAVPLEQTWRNRTGTRAGRALPDDANEGLNEHGEAPPPYKPQSEPIAPEPAVPRDSRLKPPDYH